MDYLGLYPPAELFLKFIYSKLWIAMEELVSYYFLS